MIRDDHDTTNTETSAEDRVIGMDVTAPLPALTSLEQVSQTARDLGGTGFHQCRPDSIDKQFWDDSSPDYDDDRWELLVTALHNQPSVYDLTACLIRARSGSMEHLRPTREMVDQALSTSDARNPVRGQLFTLAEDPLYNQDEYTLAREARLDMAIELMQMMGAMTAISEQDRRELRDVLDSDISCQNWGPQTILDTDWLTLKPMPLVGRGPTLLELFGTSLASSVTDLKALKQAYRRYMEHLTGHNTNMSLELAEKLAENMYRNELQDKLAVLDMRGVAQVRMQVPGFLVFDHARDPRTNTPIALELDIKVKIGDNTRSLLGTVKPEFHNLWRTK